MSEIIKWVTVKGRHIPIKSKSIENLIPVREGFSRLTGYRPKITKETEKAYLVDYQKLEGTHYGASARGGLEYYTDYSSVWLPKSQVQTYKNKVIAMPTWLAKKSQLYTEEMVKQRSNAEKSYMDLVNEAKKMGIKGARKGLKAKTLKDMISKYNKNS